MTRQLFWRLIGLALVVLAAAGCPSANPDDGQDTTDNNNDNSDGDNGDGIESDVDIAVPNEGAQHVPVGEQVAYQTNPPASGPHWSQGGVAPVAPGFYDTSIEEEQWVHNLEHGYIVVLYDCRGPCQADLLDDLQSFLASVPPSETLGTTRLVIAPYDGLPFLVTAVAWDWQMHLETFDEEALLGFYDRHVDQGPELVP